MSVSKLRIARVSIKKLLPVSYAWEFAAVNTEILLFYVIAAIPYPAPPFTCSPLFFAV